METKVSTPGKVTNALTLENISKSFPGVRALDRVNLHVSPGQVHGVVGENGAGKSTLMSVASGSLLPDTGSVTVDGEMLDPATPERARELGIAIVRQEPALMRDLSVEENLYLAVPKDKRPAAHDLRQWSTAALALWGDVPINLTDRVEQLTPQMRFIVEICRALALDPKVLILDEPTEHLVAEEVDTLFARIRERVAAGMAVIYISHRINEVKAIADSITVLRNGKTIGTHPAGELTQDEIVSLIIGRDLEAYFPDKPVTASDAQVGLKLDNLSAKGIAPVNAVFKKGEIIGLAGIEGNGQRTFLRAIAGLEHTRGSVTVNGKTISRITHATATKNRISYLSGDRHNEGVLTGLDVETNVTFRSLPKLSRLGWVSDRRKTKLARELVEDYRVKTPSLQTPIESLSGGNQQKALMGGMLATSSAVYLVDEPTQGVDVGARSEIYSVIRSAADQGATVIVLSSSALELAGLADRVMVFSRGQVVREISGEDLTEDSITRTMLTAETERERATSSYRAVSRWLAGDAAPIAIVSAFVILMTVVGAAQSASFIGPVNTSGMLALAVPLAFVAFGQCLVLLTGGIDLSTGPLMSLVVVIASFFLVDGSSGAFQATGWGLMLGTALLVGLVNWTLVEIIKLSPLIATLITYMAIQAVALILRPLPGGSISSGITITLMSVLGPVPAAFIIVVIIGIVLEIALRKSRTGISLRAVGSNAEAARINGLRPPLVLLLAYLGCSLCAGIGGVFLMAQTGVGDASQGIPYTLAGITAAVVGGASVFGGRASFVGALLGATIVQVISALTVFLQVASDWQYYLVGGLTIGAVALYSVARHRAAVSK